MALVNQFGQMIAGKHNESFLDYPNREEEEEEQEPEEENDYEGGVISYNNHVGIVMPSDEDIESNHVIHLQSPEESRRYIVQWCSEYVEQRLGRPPEYDTDLLCNLTLNDRGDAWHVPASHNFVDILMAHSERNNGECGPLLYEENQHEEFFVYHYDDVIDLVRDVSQWFEEFNVPLKSTGRICTI